MRSLLTSGLADDYCNSQTYIIFYQTFAKLQSKCNRNWRGELLFMKSFISGWKINQFGPRRLTVKQIGGWPLADDEIPLVTETCGK